MRTFDATQTAIVASANKTDVSWLFTVTTTAPVTTYWSTKAKTFAAQAYTFKVIPKSFKGITMRRSKSEKGIQTADKLTFSVSNPGNTLTASDYSDATVQVDCVQAAGGSEAIIRSWKFNVKLCTPNYQQLDFECEDFLQQYLRGDYSATRMVNDIYPSTVQYHDDNLCVPEPYGTAYIPMRLVYINEAISKTATTISFTATANGSRCLLDDSGSGLGSFEIGLPLTITGAANAGNNTSATVLSPTTSSQLQFLADTGFVTEAAGASVTLKQPAAYYLMGDTANTYTITEVSSPADAGRPSIWPSTSYTFTQSTQADAAATDWRVFQPIIGDADNDGTPDSCGIIGTGQKIYDLNVKFTRSDTASMTGPEDVIDQVLQNMGVSSGDIDTGVGSTFETAGTTFTGWGLEYNGAFWFKQQRMKALASLLVQCHSTIICTDKVELHVLSKTSVLTIDKTNVYKPKSSGAGSFKYRPMQNPPLNDAGYVAWQQSGTAQDRFIKTLVQAKSTENYISQEVLKVNFVQDSQMVQKIGKLFYQRKFLPIGLITVTLLSSCFAADPDDVVTVNHADYGGSTTARIDSITYKPDLLIDVKATVFSDTLDDWSDLSPAAITITDMDIADDRIWQPQITGPLTDQPIAANFSNAWGQPYIIVGPDINSGEYTAIQDAINALPDNGGRIYIRNGVYQLSDAIYMPDKDIIVEGESLGVEIRNNPPDPVFSFSNYSSIVQFKNIYIPSQTTGIGGVPNAMIDGSSFSGSFKMNNVIIEPSVYESAIQLIGTNSDVVEIGDCRFEQAAWTNQAMVYIDLDATKTSLKNNYVLGGDYGIRVKSGDYAEVTGNTVVGFHDIGISVETTGGKITNNPKIESSSTTRTLYGIIVASTVYNEVIITGNDVKITVDAIGFSGFGIYVGDINSSLVSNNKIAIMSSVATGDMIAIRIKVYNYGADYNTIIGNNIIVNASAATTREGIHIEGIDGKQADSNVIQGNSINCVNNNAADIGIYLSTYTSDNYVAADNIILNCGTDIDDNG